MPDWLIWLAAFWFLFGCGTGCRRVWHRRRLGAAAGPGEGNTLQAGQADPAIAASIPAGSPSSGVLPGSGAPPVAGRSETALESLQRRFVDGAITLKQYEAELDRLDRKELG